MHDVGTGSGAVALALAHERPDLTVSASDVSPDAVEVARANAAALGLDVAIEVADGLPPGDYDLVVANLPYVRDDEWDGARARDPRATSRAWRSRAGRRPRRDPRAGGRRRRAGTALALEHGHGPGPRPSATLLRDGARTERDLAGRDRVTVGTAP